MNRRLGIFGLALTAMLPLAAFLGAKAEAEDGRTVAGPVAAAVTKVRDGDTVEVEAFIWPQQVVRTAVRLKGVDAPELRGRCPAEQKAAEAARDRLAALVGNQTVQLSEVSGDKYFGRVLARVAVNGVPDVGRQLLSEGLVAPYRGDRRRDWCANEAKLSNFRPFG